MDHPGWSRIRTRRQFDSGSISRDSLCLILGRYGYCCGGYAAQTQVVACSIQLRSVAQAILPALLRSHWPRTQHLTKVPAIAGATRIRDFPTRLDAEADSRAIEWATSRQANLSWRSCSPSKYAIRHGSGSRDSGRRFAFEKPLSSVPISRGSDLESPSQCKCFGNSIRVHQ